MVHHLYVSGRKLASTVAKAVLSQAKSKGAKGEGFDELEERLDEKQINIIETVSEESPSKPQTQDPPQNQIQALVNLYTQGQMQQVISESERLLSEYPSSFTLYNIFGAATQALGKLDDAIKAYQKAISIKPDYLDAYYNIGNTLREQGDLDEAIEAYQKALAIKPDYADAHNNMGVALQDQGNLDEAIAAYQKAISIKPDYSNAYYNMGNTLRKNGDLEQAIEAIKAILLIMLRRIITWVLLCKIKVI